MTSPSPLTGEASNHKIAAIFDTEATARGVFDRLRAMPELATAQVQLITPGDRRPGRKLEPESHGIFRTILRAHATLGAVGAVAGLLAFAVFRAMGIRWVSQSPVMAAGIFLFFGAMAGLMLGGLFALRPDHDPYIHRVLAARREGRSAVVIHAFSAEQRAVVESLLGETPCEIVSTL